MRTERVTIPTAPGPGRPDGGRLAADLDLPTGVRRGVALFAHCFSCGKDLKSAKRLTSRLTAHGWAVLRFDFTGLGGSEGSFADSNFSSNIGDLLAAVDWLRQMYAPPSLLIGHSLGGAAVLAAAERVPELAAVASIGAPSDPAHVLHAFDDHLDDLERADPESTVEVDLGGRPFRVKRQFVEDIRSHALLGAVADMRVPLLIMHAPQDTVVGIDHGLRLFDAAPMPKSFIALDGADHLLLSPSVAEQAAEALAGWADGFRDAALRPSDDILEPAAEGEVVVSERDTGPYAQTVRVADRHVFLADEPLGVGDDTGPSPYDLLLSALGTCTSMTLRMYADRRGYPLEHVSVRLSHERIHAKDCRDCESVDGRVDVIQRHLSVHGPLSDEQRADLIRIADRCPVHRTLGTETVVRTTTGETAGS